MAAEENPFEAVRVMMLENLERVGLATQTYIDMVERTMRNVPGANQEQIRTFVEYIERQVAANRDFGEKLLRAKDFQEAFRTGRVLSGPIEGRHFGCSSDWRKDGWLVQYVHSSRTEHRVEHRYRQWRIRPCVFTAGCYHESCRGYSCFGWSSKSLRGCSSSCRASRTISAISGSPSCSAFSIALSSTRARAAWGSRSSRFMFSPSIV